MLTNEKPRDNINKLSRTTEKKVGKHRKNNLKKFLTSDESFGIIQKLLDESRTNNLDN